MAQYKVNKNLTPDQKTVRSAKIESDKAQPIAPRTPKKKGTAVKGSSNFDRLKKALF